VATFRINPATEELEIQVPGQGWAKAIVSVSSAGAEVGGGGAVAVADGADVTQGSTTDAAIVTDANGTHSGKLRGLVKMIANAWDSTNGALRVYLATGINFAVDSIVTYPFGHNTTVIATATTTVVKAGPGTARKIWVAGGTLGAVTIYNNTAGSGTQLFPGLTPAANAVVMEDQAFDTGLTIVTAAATIIVCSWR
jgi:hypothetical protein